MAYDLRDIDAVRDCARRNNYFSLTTERNGVSTVESVSEAAARRKGFAGTLRRNLAVNLKRNRHAAQVRYHAFASLQPMEVSRGNNGMDKVVRAQNGVDRSVKNVGICRVATGNGTTKSEDDGKYARFQIGSRMLYNYPKG